MTLLPVPPSHLWRLRNLKGRLIRTHPENDGWKDPEACRESLLSAELPAGPALESPGVTFIHAD